MQHPKERFVRILKRIKKLKISSKFLLPYLGHTLLLSLSLYIVNLIVPATLLVYGAIAFLSLAGAIVCAVIVLNISIYTLQTKALKQPRVVIDDIDSLIGKIRKVSDKSKQYKQTAEQINQYLHRLETKKAQAEQEKIKISQALKQGREKLSSFEYSANNKQSQVNDFNKDISSLGLQKQKLEAEIKSFAQDLKVQDKVVQLRTSEVKKAEQEIEKLKENKLSVVSEISDLKAQQKDIKKNTKKSFSWFGSRDSDNFQEQLDQETKKSSELALEITNLKKKLSQSKGSSEYDFDTIKSKTPKFPTSQLARKEIERKVARTLADINGQFHVSGVIQTIEKLYPKQAKGKSRIKLLNEIKEWISKDRLCQFVEEIDNIQYYKFI